MCVLCCKQGAVNSSPGCVCVYRCVGVIINLQPQYRLMTPARCLSMPNFVTISCIRNKYSAKPLGIWRISLVAWIRPQSNNVEFMELLVKAIDDLVRREPFGSCTSRVHAFCTRGQQSICYSILSFFSWFFSSSNFRKFIPVISMQAIGWRTFKSSSNFSDQHQWAGLPCTIERSWALLVSHYSVRAELADVFQQLTPFSVENVGNDGVAQVLTKLDKFGCCIVYFQRVDFRINKTAARYLSCVWRH